MAIQLPGNMRFVKDGGRPQELDMGDVLGFPGGEGEEQEVVYNEETAALIQQMVTADDQYSSFRMVDNAGRKLGEAFVDYADSEDRITYSSVRFTGDIRAFITKKKLGVVAQVTSR